MPAEEEACYLAPNNSLQVFTIASAYSNAYPYDFLAVKLKSVYDPNDGLDVTGLTTNGGELLQLYPCNGGGNQTFNLPLQPNIKTYQAIGPIYVKTVKGDYSMVLGTASGQPRLVVPIWQQKRDPTNKWQVWRVATKPF